MFQTKRDDYFVTLVPGTDPVPVGEPRSRGVELDVVGNPFKGFSVIGNLAYVDAVNHSAALASVALLATNQSVFSKQISSTPKIRLPLGQFTRSSRVQWPGSGSAQTEKARGKEAATPVALCRSDEGLSHMPRNW